MRRGIFFISAIVFLVLLAVGGCRHAGRYLVKEELPVTPEGTPGRADAIVMLQGTIADRVLQCADLLGAGPGATEPAVSDRLIMVEEGMDSYGELLDRGVKVMSQTRRVEDMFLQLGMPADKITIVPGGAVSTLDEARYIRTWLAGHPEINSIVLVSSSYHLRRASRIFRVAFRELGRPVEIYCSPSTYSDTHPATWWRSKEDIQSVLSEYVKIGAFHFIERRRLKD